MADIPPPSVASQIITSAIPLASAGVGALLTYVLTARRSYDEKIWELRRVAYSVVLAELMAVEGILDVAGEYIEENEMRYFHDKVHERHNEIIAKHMKVARKAFTDNYIVLSDAFISLFEGMLHAMDDRNQNRLPPEEHEMFEKAIRLARPKLLLQARKEMPLRGKRVWRNVA